MVRGRDLAALERLVARLRLSADPLTAGLMALRFALAAAATPPEPRDIDP